jgi:hypothetical protein
MYAFTFRSEDKAVLVFRFDNTDEAVSVLQSKQVNVVAGVELYDRVEK